MEDCARIHVTLSNLRKSHSNQTHCHFSPFQSWHHECWNFYSPAATAFKRDIALQRSPRNYGGCRGPNQSSVCLMCYQVVRSARVYERFDQAFAWQSWPPTMAPGFWSSRLVINAALVVDNVLYIHIECPWQRPLHTSWSIIAVLSLSILPLLYA